MNKLLHLFYSGIAAEMFGTTIYKTVDGQEVHVTAAAEDANYVKENYKWHDAIYVGQGTFLRRGNPGEYDAYDGLDDRYDDGSY